MKLSAVEGVNTTVSFCSIMHIYKGRGLLVSVTTKRSKFKNRSRNWRLEKYPDVVKFHSATLPISFP